MNFVRVWAPGKPARRPSAAPGAILNSMAPWRLGIGCLIVLLVVVPTIRLAPSAADDVSQQATLKASRAPSGVGRSTVATPSVVTLVALFAPRGLDVPGAPDSFASADPTRPFVPPRG